MKKNEAKPQTKASIDVILEYKKGNLSRVDAIQRFSALTGLNLTIAETFIEPLTKCNIIVFPNKFND